MIKLNKPKVVAQDPIKKLLTLMKGEKHLSAVSFLMRKMEPADAAEYVKDKLVKSEFKTFKLAMNRFLEAYDCYKLSGDKKYLSSYIDSINYKFHDEVYHLQIVSEKIFIGLLKNDNKFICEALYYLITRYDLTWIEDPTEESVPEDTLPKFKSIVADLAAKVFPEAGALQVLFGDKK